MHVLITGRGTSGSWQIRGAQMAAVIGAQAKPMASFEDCRAADLIVVVKKIPEALLLAIRKSGRPWVYDIVDAYPQPQCTAWGQEVAKAWLKEHLRVLRPDFVIWPNQRMQEDAGGGGAVIYHHHWPKIKVNPVRERIEVIGYEGAPAYLEGWRGAIEDECRARGARFVINPGKLAEVDVILALRGKAWNGYVQQNWKSQVKLANAHGSGTPFVGAPESGYLEVACGAEHWVTNPEGLTAALEALAPQQARQEVKEKFLNAAYPMEAAGSAYSGVLSRFLNG